jgi:hypothetical protein
MKINFLPHGNYPTPAEVIYFDVKQVEFVETQNGAFLPYVCTLTVFTSTGAAVFVIRNS